MCNGLHLLEFLGKTSIFHPISKLFSSNFFHCWEPCQFLFDELEVQRHVVGSYLKKKWTQRITNSEDCRDSNLSSSRTRRKMNKLQELKRIEHKTEKQLIDLPRLWNDIQVGIKFHQHMTGYSQAMSVIDMNKQIVQHVAY